MYPGLLCLFFNLTFSLIFTEADIVKDLETGVTCLKSDSYDWYVRSIKKCPKEDLYHCLHDENDRQKFYEFCGDFITIPPGKYPVFRPDPPKILLRDCVGDTFQNQFLKSNILNNCFDRKKCDDKGQLVCENGSQTEDRRCKCDISVGMVIQIYGDSPSNKRTCCPDSDRSCDCFPKKCDPGFVLNEMYQCVIKCETSGCVSTTSSNDDVTKEPTKQLTDSVSTTSTVTTENELKSTEMSSVARFILIAFAAIIVFSLTIIVIYARCHRPFNKLTTGSYSGNSDERRPSDDVHIEMKDDGQEREHMLGPQKNINDDGQEVEHMLGTEENVKDNAEPSGDCKKTINVNFHGPVVFNKIKNADNVATGSGSKFIKNGTGEDDDDDATDLEEVNIQESDTCDNSDFKGFL